VWPLKRPNYNAAKRAREIKQKEKRDAKLARKHAAKAGHQAQPEPAATPDSVPAAPQEDEGGPLSGPQG
jgi:hypothetical protein